MIIVWYVNYHRFLVGRHKRVGFFNAPFDDFNDTNLCKNQLTNFPPHPTYWFYITFHGGGVQN